MKPPAPHTALHAGDATLRFYEGDCVDVSSRLAAASTDVVVTSPPYNLGIRYNS